MSHQLGIIPGSLLSLVLVAAAVNASGCVAEASLDEDDFDSQEAALCASASGWAEGVAYTVGSVVNYGGRSYSCRQSHTSLAGWTPSAVPALWLETGTCSSSSSTSASSGGSGGGGGGGGGGCSYPAWQRGKSYRTGDIVVFNGSPYIAEHDNPGYDPTISTWFWDPHAGCGGGGGGGGGGNGGGGGGGGGGDGFGAILSESVFNTMFPGRNPFYTYRALIAAASTFPGLATTGDADTRKREVAAFLANASHETGGLVYVEEIAKAQLCDTSWGPPGCSCAPGKSYYGRGPIQLSWNGNYCAAGNALGLPLQSNPDLVAQDANVAWRTAFWFWTTQTGAGTRTAHDAMVTGAGFGETIRTINGALECNGRNPAQVQSRVDRYMQFTRLLGVSPGNNTGC
ncbi:glycoside hydrolase family 19 protein [Sorangium sp. So ce1014]|uniref:glycoside hydrolase family 19 protein n=1 Tax=Sorangium sp. So ce1014 TaxID=3133326 RepID=UPI003F60E3F6